MIEVIAACYQKLHNVILSADPSNYQLLRYASKLMRLCLQKFSCARMACVLDSSAVKVIEEFLPSWSRLVIQWLSGITNIADIYSRLGLILEFLRSISVALEAFPDEFGESLSDSMRTSWSLLCMVRDQNQRRALILGGIGKGSYFLFTSDLFIFFVCLCL